MDLTGVEDIDGKFIGIHTRTEGAKIYAQQITEGLRALDFDELSNQLRWLRLPDPKVYLTELALPKNAADLIHRIALKITASGDNPAQFHVLQHQDVGPFSPVLDITTTPGVNGRDADKTQLSVWDEYCHYSRSSFLMMHQGSCPAGTTITVNMARSLTDPDYASCRRKGLSWPPPRDRGMRANGPIVIKSDHPLEVVFAGFQPRIEETPVVEAALMAKQKNPSSISPALSAIRKRIKLVSSQVAEPSPVLMPAHLPASEQAQGLIAQGQRILEDGTRTQARPYFAAALQIDPTVAMLNWGLLPVLEGEGEGIYRDRMVARLQSWHRAPYSAVHAPVVALTDKDAMRRYVEALGLPLPQLHGGAQNLDRLNWDTIPTDRLVIKPLDSGDSQGVVVAVDGIDHITGSKIEPDLKTYTQDLYKRTFKRTPPVQVEQCLTDVDTLRDPSIIIPKDYKVFCIAGRAVFVRVHDRNGPNSKRHMATFDRNGARVPAMLTGWDEAPDGPPPQGFDALIVMAEKISQTLPWLLRFDFYLTPDGPVFGEITTFPNAGMDNTPLGRRTLLQMWEIWPD